MPRGNPLNKEEMLERVKPYLRRGLGVRRACDFAGIPNSTIYTWYKNDEVVRAQILEWQNEVSTKAIDNWNKKVEDGDYHASKAWLEANETQFKPKQEIEHQGGVSLVHLSDLAEKHVKKKDTNK